MHQLFDAMGASCDEQITLMREYRKYPADIAMKKMKQKIKELEHGYGCRRYQPHDNL